MELPARNTGSGKCQLRVEINHWPLGLKPANDISIKPRLATQGQDLQRRLPSTDTLLGAPTSSPATLATQPAPSAKPAPIRQAPASTPPAQVAPLRRRTIAPAPVNTAPQRQVTPPATQPAAPVRQAPQTPAPLSKAPERKVTPATPNPAAPAPVRQAAPTQPAPTSKVLSRSEIDAVVTKSERPAGTVLRDAPPPQVSFKPLEAAAAPAPQTAAPVPPTTPNVAAQATDPKEVIRFPTRKRAASAAPRPINTVPAGSVPEAAASPSKPYENLRKRTYPDFSVNSGTVLTGEEIAQQEALADKTIDHVDIDSVDLATDIGEPLVQNPVGNNRQTVPSGGGAGS